MLPERYVGELLVAAPDLEQAAQRLIDEANNAGGRDNITVVMFRVEDASMVPAEDPSSTAIMPAAEAAAGGYPSASTEGAPRQATPAPAVAGGTGFGADRLVGRATTKLPLARTQGPAGVSGRRQLGRFGKTMAALVTILVLLFFFGAGGYLASRQLYFIGTDEQGTVVVYRGFPYKLPFGIPMYETYYISGVPASLIPADRRTAFLNHELHSETSSFKLINDLELGKISG
jgi:protein phosphatase